MLKKTAKGRQKIEIKRIDREDCRNVTFSKRKSGIFKKASDLVTLCGAETAIIMFSPGGNAFSFGHPKVEHVIDRFLTQETIPEDGTGTLPPVDESYHEVAMSELNRQYNELRNQLEAEEKRRKMLEKKIKANQAQSWWESDIEKVSLHELERLKVAMENLKYSLVNKTDELLMESSSSLSPFLAINSLVNPFIHQSTRNNTCIISHGHGLLCGHNTSTSPYVFGL
ncbi:PREDICTED: agamous-like MADS-box protein AGL62 [Nelumbo nucifera]|uniref:MADS-box domain-containing protein n=2 Tax=Nelumbo nucifera TaxID=4432 RepID=A0A822ZM01_NELNU|nr:PREDICTED: agamous-like MADS-box protein AGL62 [Nelumbo nucifera]DAD45917.1 TPA_asm: hypothetical protein HUJ06_004147 [Nelumbo nucifera]